MKTFLSGTNIADTRHALDLSRAQLADALCVAPTTVLRWENAKVAAPEGLAGLALEALVSHYLASRGLFDSDEGRSELHTLADAIVRTTLEAGPLQALQLITEECGRFSRFHPSKWIAPE